MPINSINKQPNSQSFGRLIIDNKKEFASFSLDYL